MPSKPATPPASETETPELSLSAQKVCQLIVKFREFDVKVAVSIPDPGSNASDDAMISVLEDAPDDPARHEIASWISDMSEDEQIDLVTLAWLGRDDYSASDWPAVREEAARAHNQRTAEYLLGTPLVGDYLEEGLSMLGYSCGEFEIERL